jgi:putative inorganic carbon (hco3(-)) transporter
MKIVGYGAATAPRRAWLIWLEPAWVILLAPVFLFPNPHRSVLFLLMPLLFGLHYCARKKIVEPCPANTPLVLLLLMVFVSLFASYDLVLSLPKIAGVLLGAAIYFAIINFAFTERSLAILVVAALGGMVAFSALALTGMQWTAAKVPLLEWITGHLPHWIKGVPGAEEGFYPNAVAGALILFLPMQISLASLFFQEHGKNKTQFLMLLGSVGVTGAALLLCQSRGSWLGLGAGLLALFAWRRRWGKWLAAFAILGAVLLWARLGPEKIGNDAMTSVGGNLNVASTFDARKELWDRAILGITDFPLTGMGMNTFRKVTPVLYPLFVSPLFLPANRDIANCHNQWLQTALDIGIPGLIAYIALLAAAVAMGFQIWRRCERAWMRAAAQGLACGIIAQQVFGIADAIALGAKVGMFFWIAVGILAAMYRLATPATERNKPAVPGFSIGRWFRCRFWDALLLWIAAAALAISFIAGHPFMALTIAILGGIALGIACVLGEE